MIVNADDFGRSPAVNDAVVRAFDAGLISSATIMVNMPGFQRACELAHERGLLPHVGVHLVLTDGVPVTRAMRSSRRFCDADGHFLPFTATGRHLRLDATERRTLTEELGAQIGRARAAGLPVTHLDSHHQMHNQLAVAAVVVGLARRLRIPAVRLAENVDPRATLKHRAGAASVNALMRTAGLARTRYFGSVEGFLRRRGHDPRWPVWGDVELMVHPTLTGERSLVDEPSKLPLRELLARVGEPGGAVSYARARYRGSP